MNPYPFIILGAGVDSLAIIDRVQQEFPVLAIDGDKNAPGFKAASSHLVASCYSSQASLGALDAAGILPVGVLCGGVDAPHVQGAVSWKYGLVGPSPKTAWLSWDKRAQLEELGRAGVRVPAFRIARGSQDLLGWATSHIVLKPTDSRGARGVLRLPADLPEEEMAVWLITSRSYSPSQTCIVQPWVEGEQLSTESLVQDGRVLWTSIAARNYSRLDEFAPHVIEDGSDIPWMPHYGGNGHSPEDKVNEALRACVEAIGLENGTMKGDLVWNGNVTVIEVSARLSGGGFCSVLTPTAWGVDFVGLAMNIALGRQIEAPRPKLLRPVQQRFSFPFRPRAHPDRGPWVLR